MKILWFFGPKENLWNGVGQYSKLISDELKSTYHIKVEEKYIPYKSRSLMRYVYQFFVYPLIMIFNSKGNDIIVLYQEDLAFLVPIARLFNKKVFLIYHHLPTQTSTETLLEKLKLFYLKLTSGFISSSNKIICPSNQTLHCVSKALNINIDKFSVIYNCFEKKQNYVSLNKEKFFEKLGIEIDNDLIFLNVGSDETRKNLITLFESLCLIQNVKYKFIRVGKSVTLENKTAIDEIVYKNNLNVSFVDFLSDDDLRDMYFHSDFYISPSVHEGFGRTVIEAQLYGTPVIASKIPVYEEIMGTSFFPVEDFGEPLAWAEAIESVIHDYNHLIDLGFHNSERFSRSNVAGEFYKLLF